MLSSRWLSRIGILAVLLFFTFYSPLQSAQPGKPAKASKLERPIKERLVLMPLLIDDEDKGLQSAMETALAEGLQQKYSVLSGEQVAQKVREVFRKESLSAKGDCDETRCMQDIAIAFQAELIAIANVAKRDDGHFLSLSIRNIFENKIVYSKSTPCKNCDDYRVLESIKELGRDALHADGGATAPQTQEIAIKNGNVMDPEIALWNEVKDGDSIDDLETYVARYPNGRYSALAKKRIESIQKEADNDAARIEEQAWLDAEQSGSETGYQNYLKTYPQGQYVGLVQVKIRKLKFDQAARDRLGFANDNSGRRGSSSDRLSDDDSVALRGRAAVVRKAEVDRKPGEVFKDCANCPYMVVLPAGEFDMGSNEGSADEKPMHRVSISAKFAIGKTEVTQGQWRAILGSNPSYFSVCGDNCPVENVSWDDAQQFIRLLNAKTGKRYQLPSGARWEYACRAGGKSKYCGGEEAGSVGWLSDNSNMATHPVASKQANAWGLYDMSGNVWEWIEDSYHDSYLGAPVDGSVWAGDGVKRVLRGGSWNSSANILRSAFYIKNSSGSRADSIGFRISRSLP